MTVKRASLTVAGSTLVLTLIGAGIGFMLGRFAPNYYRGVFYNGDSPDFDPVQVGLGQGITQGLVGGVVVGLAIVYIVAWQEACKREGSVINWRLPRWLLMTLAAGTGGAIGYLIGSCGPILVFLLYLRLTGPWPPNFHAFDGLGVVAIIITGPLMTVIGCIMGASLTAKYLSSGEKNLTLESKDIASGTGAGAT